MPDPNDLRPRPTRGGVGIYDRPSRRPLWVGAGLAAALAAAVSAIWWLT